jgi:carbon-monoxide dehydrogenase medium subunit
VKPAPFTWSKAGSIEECLDGLAADEDTKIIAGGQSLMPLMALRMARPAHLVDVNGLTELSRFGSRGGSTVIGALVRHAVVAADPALGARLPVLGAAARQIGHVAIRNRGTIGGSLAHADPAAEMPAVLMLLEARIMAASAARGVREVPAAGFVSSPYDTALEPDEMITWIVVPDPVEGTRFGFAEIAPRPGDYARMGVACLVTPHGRVRAVGFGSLPAPTEILDRTDLTLPSTMDAVDCGVLAAQWVSESDAEPGDPMRRRLLVTALTRALFKAMGSPHGSGVNGRRAVLS